MQRFETPAPPFIHEGAGVYRFNALSKPQNQTRTIMRKFLTCALLLSLHWAGVHAQSKDIFEANTILEIKLTLKEAEWDKLLDTYKQAGSEERLIGDAVINGVTYKEVGIRYKGNSSYFRVRDLDENKLPFNIKINETTKSQKLPGGISTLKLANAFLDPSFVREVLAYEIAGKYMPSPRANFAKVYVNGTYLGLYNCTESIDDLFLEKHFGTSKGALVKCDPNWHVKPKSNCKSSDNASLAYVGEDSVCYMSVYELQDHAHWKDVIRLTRILEKEPQKIEETLNIDQTLWMLAFNNVLVNLDSYTGQLCHNYYLYLDTFGVYHTLVWDMNLSFGGFRLTGAGPSLSEAGMQTMSPFLHFKDSDSGRSVQRPLITKLLSNDLYQKIYLAHIRTILEENFSNGLYLKRAKEIQQFVDKSVKDDVNKLYDYALFQKNLDTTVVVDEKRIVGIKELMGKRTKYLETHPLLQRTPPAISEVAHAVEGEKINISAKVEGSPTKVWLCYRYSENGAFQRIEMGGTAPAYLAGIENKPGAQYYLIAENAQAASLSPARAAKEFYQVK